jgi:hypothetical protein
VKNLRAKDYLGKAKLVAAVDRNNAFTGFQGAEIKRMNSIDASKDDRLASNISFAASNLVKSDIKSRSRQQSEPPPPQRDVFPPTPPPDTDRSSGANGGSVTRAESVRAGPRPRPLDLSVAGFEKPKPGMDRSQTDRGPVGRSRTQSEKPLPGLRAERRPSYASGRSDMRSPGDAYEDVYDMYGRQSTYGPRKGQGTRTMISEEDEGEYNDFDEPDFDMMSRTSGRASRGPPRYVEVSRIRVKVHADDTRYVMIGPAIEFRDMVDQIRAKFGIRQNFILSIKDDGDMITMSDQDDLDMALMSSVADARKEGSELGRMEVSLSLDSNPHD